MRARVSEFFSKNVYTILSEEHSMGRSNLEVATELLDSGVKIIQYREKHKKSLYKYKECLELRRLTEKYGCLFIVNDDIDIAILTKADGVHIGQEDLPICEVRKLVGEHMIIGRSTHSPVQAREALAVGADYIGVGPIYSTKTKVDVCKPVGLEYLRYVAENLDIPFVAIGGIKEHNLASVLEAGANCVCLVTEIVGAEDIASTVASIKKAVESGH